MTFGCRLLRQELSANLCDWANQDVTFGMEKYGLYFDKIRVFFVPSLEHRIYSLLEEFVYNTNSRWTKQCPCLEKFFGGIITWRDSLDNAGEGDIDSMEKIIKIIIKFITKNNPITFFLDSITLYRRLNKVCRELDSLGIENNILRSSTARNFVDERDSSLNCDCCTRDFNTPIDRSVNLNAVFCNARKSMKYKRTVKSLVKNTYNGGIKYAQPSTSKYRERRQVLGSNKNFLQQNEENSNQYSTRVAIGSQNNDIDSRMKSFNEKPCDFKLKKIRNSMKLKIIVRDMFSEDYKRTSFKTSRLPLPCRPSDLITLIFEADPFLIETCLIVMKRKFENSMYNVSSCLNNVLDKLNTKFSKALRLNCEIYPGYISFKLKAGDIKKCLFVARVPVCQNVRKRTIQQVHSVSSANTNLNSVNEEEISESKCHERRSDSDINFNALECTDEDAENFGARCSQLDQSSVKDVTIDTSQNVAENNNEKSVARTMTENASRCVRPLAISSRDNSPRDVAEVISNATSCLDKINCDGNAKKCSRENYAGTDDGIGNIFRNNNSGSTTQITDVSDPKWICSSEKKSNPENETCNTDTCSVTSFVQNSDDDKQLVELNYNRFSRGNINSTDKRFSTEKNDNDTLDSTKVDLEYSSHCSCQRDDFVNVTFNDDTSEENIFCTFETSHANVDATEARTSYSKTVQISPRNNNLLTISVRVPRSTILLKEIDVDAGYSRTIWLISSGDKNAPDGTKASDQRSETASHSARALIVSEEGSNLSNINTEMFNVEDYAQDFIASRIRFSTPKGKSQTNEDLRTSGISTSQYLRAENHSSYATSNSSLRYRSFATSEFIINSKRDKFREPDKLKKPSKFRRREFMRSRSKISSGTSTTIKREATPRRHPNDYPAKTRPQAILAMTKFRNSVDKSVDRVKHLFRAKLRKILFSDKMTKAVSRNKESFRDIKKNQTGDRYMKQGCVTSRSTCECCRQDYIVSSCESSNVILSIRKTNKENTQFRDYKSTNGSRDLLRFRSIKTSPCNGLTSVTNNVEKRSSRYDGKKKITNATNYDKSCHRYDFKRSRTSIMVSSESTEISLTQNDSKYSRHCTCKRQEKICDKKHIFGALTDVCNDYIDDLDRDFKLRLLKYVKLCKSIKHSLTRTLRSNDIYGINTPSQSDNDL